MTVAVRPDIVACLESMRQDVERRIASLDRFRALKAIEQTIAEFPGLDDLTRSLSEIADQVRLQLDETREFRALRSIERIMPELSEVLALMEHAPTAEVRPTGSAPVETEEFAPAILEHPVASEAGGDASGFEIAATGPADEAGTMAHAMSVRSESAGHPPGAGTEAGLEMQHRLSRSEAIPPAPDTEPMPSLADSVAQLMAQSMAPQREGQAPPAPHSHERGDAPLTQAERAA